MPNPYPETIVDESSGIEVKNDKHEAWGEGYSAGGRDMNQALSEVESKLKEKAKPRKRTSPPKTRTAKPKILRNRTLPKIKKLPVRLRFVKYISP